MNSINYNDKNFQAATVAVMNDFLSSKMEGTTMDDAYKAVCKYASVTREKFEELYKQACKKVDSWKNVDNSAHELCDDDLDMVVGGSAVGDFFGKIADGFKEAGVTIADGFKNHAAEIAIVAGFIIACGALGVGAVFGAAAIGLTATATTGAAVGAGVIGSSIGLVLGTTIATA